MGNSWVRGNMSTYCADLRLRVGHVALACGSSLTSEVRSTKEHNRFVNALCSRESPSTQFRKWEKLRVDPWHEQHSCAATQEPCGARIC